MKTKLLSLVFIILFSKKLCSQDTKTEMAIYNIGINAVFSGIGSLINKKPNEKWGKTFLKGMGQGALGGYLIYESKNLIGEITNKKAWEYGWYAKIVNSAGTSIVENASSNRNFWEKWHLNIGFNRIEFHTKDKFKVKYKIMPVSLALTFHTAINSKFEFKRSLQTGELIFSTTNYNEYSGFAIGNVITINEKSIDSYDIYSHEIIHIYQYYDFNFINTYLNKTINRWEQKSNTFKKINNFFYIDFQAPIQRSLYLLENLNRNCYYDNFFENEANFYSLKVNCNN
jgi:hypothetical protein